MLDGVRKRFELDPDRIAGDVAYGTGVCLGKLVGRDIEPHVPVWDQSEIAAKGKFSRAAFSFDKEQDVYICPKGKELRSSSKVHNGNTLKYFAR